MQTDRRLLKLQEIARDSKITSSELLTLSYFKLLNYQKFSKAFKDGFGVEMELLCNEIRFTETDFNPGTLSYDAWMYGKSQAREYFNYQLLKLREFRAWGYQITVDDENKVMDILSFAPPALLSKKVKN
jgi:hypothetical protein